MGKLTPQGIAYALALGAALVGAPARSQEQAEQTKEQKVLESIKWEVGPATGALSDKAAIALPAGYRFANPPDTRKLLELMGNPTSGEELGLVMPDDGSWFVIFEFSDIGYVKDDEKDKLDADQILESIKQGTAAANKERQKRGWGTLDIVGWEHKPAYNQETHNLEWAVRARSDKGGDVLNHNTRILGRHGVMEVNLVVDPEILAKTMPAYNQLLAGFAYKTGNGYAEFKKGDKIAEYGLAALIAGGAATVALKSGFLAKFWKFIVIGVIAIGGALKRAVGSLFGRRSRS